jgi:hypothetical protein
MWHMLLYPFHIYKLLKLNLTLQFSKLKKQVVAYFGL